MIGRFAGYLNNTWNFSQLVSGISDWRLYPEIPTSSIWLSLFGMYAVRLPSFNALEDELRLPGRWEPWTGHRKPSADTMSYVLERFDLEKLRYQLVRLNRQMKRKKVLKLKNPPYIVAALDGHELFCSYKRCCNKCLVRTVETAQGPQTQYHHRVVVLQIIDAWPPLILDIEFVLPGEGEVAAAERILERARKQYQRFFDILSVDALYLVAPFFQKAQNWGWDIIAVLKQENRELYQDAEGLLRVVKSEELPTEKGRLQHWDLDGLTTWRTLGMPIRVIVEKGEKTKRERIAGEWRESMVASEWRWATTLNSRVFNSCQVSRWGHARWDIENRGFNELVQHWAMDHCFHHHPTAIMACLLTLAMAFSLTTVFFERNLKPELRLRLKITRLALARLLFNDLAKEWVGSFWARAP